MDATELAAITADLAAARGDRPILLAIRRGETTLAAQAARFERGGGESRAVVGRAGQEQRARGVVTGPPDLDVQVADRFTVAGVVYRILFVSPNRSVCTIADAVAVE